MAKGETTQPPKSAEDLMNPFLQLQEAGLGSLKGMNTAWLDAMGDMGAEVVSFVADRIKEDVKTQHEIMKCRTVADLQHVQAQFMQKAMDQYHEETGKLVEMGTQAFAALADDAASKKKD